MTLNYSTLTPRIMAACMLCRFLHSFSGSTQCFQKPLLQKPTIFTHVHRSAWYRSLFQSDQERSAPDSSPSESTSRSNSGFTKPKQPPNVFLMYIAKVQDSIKKENPNANRRDIVNEASRRWKELNPEEKSILAIERKEMYDKFKEAKRLYVENMTPEQIKLDLKERERKEIKKLKKVRKILGMPEKPWSSYKWFLSEKFAERADEDIRAYFKKSKDLWMSMTPEEKEVYHQKQREAQAKYQREMMEWEECMIEDGRFDVVRKGTLVKLKLQNSKQTANKRKNRVIGAEDD